MAVPRPPHGQDDPVHPVVFSNPSDEQPVDYARPAETPGAERYLNAPFLSTQD
ncbi:hypothetical protein ACFS2C_10190 [Prauserella oleivorans]|uniref:Uncharacterized protein n=1 Tax=Prauserella oleivorans TaxID=1478153 RepID=A0ABW5W945_9PSEU